MGLMPDDAPSAVVDDTVNDAGDATGEVTNTASDILDDAASDAEDTAGSVLDSGSDAASEIADTAADAMDSAVDTAGDLFDKADVLHTVSDAMTAHVAEHHTPPPADESDSDDGITDGGVVDIAIPDADEITPDVQETTETHQRKRRIFGKSR